MKQKLLTLLMVLIFAGNCFSRSQSNDSVETFYKFWDLALSNDIESAKKYALGSSIKSNDYEQIRKPFGIIFADQLKITKIESAQSYPTMAFLRFRAKGKDESLFSGQALLYKPGKEWKILYFEMKRGVERLEIPQDNETTPGFPYLLPRGFPVKKECPKCVLTFHSETFCFILL